MPAADEPVGGGDAAADARCAAHPDRPAAGICDRCGAFACEACFVPTGDGHLCPSCRDAEGLGGLDTFIAARRERPDVFVWWLGLSLAVMYGGAFLRGVDLGSRSPAFHGELAILFGVNLATDFAGLVIAIAYLRRRRWSRLAVFVPVIVSGLEPLFQLAVAGGHVAVHGGLVVALGVVFLGVLFALMIVAWRSPVNRLAFGLEVPRPRLEAAYRAYQGNRVAVIALGFAVPAAIIPFVFLFALPPVSVAIWRSRRPGVRRRGLALAAAILCMVGFLVTVSAVIFSRLHGHG